MVPNTTVHKRSALAGSLVAAILLEVGKRFMGAYLENALTIRQLYGSLGLIPLFMFWVYLMWVVVLFGLEVSATLQMLGGRRLEELERKRAVTGVVDPASVLPVMQAVAGRFQHGAPITARQITEEASVPEPTVLRLLEQLEQAGFVHRLAHPEEAFTLALPPDQIAADRLLDIGYELVEESAAPNLPILEQIREAQRAVAARKTLASLRRLTPAGD
jgi:membrane protein